MTFDQYSPVLLGGTSKNIRQLKTVAGAPLFSTIFSKSHVCDWRVLMWCLWLEQVDDQVFFTNIAALQIGRQILLEFRNSNNFFVGVLGQIVGLFLQAKVWRFSNNTVRNSLPVYPYSRSFLAWFQVHYNFGKAACRWVWLGGVRQSSLEHQTKSPRFGSITISPEQATQLLARRNRTNSQNYGALRQS